MNQTKECRNTHQGSEEDSKEEQGNEALECPDKSTNKRKKVCVETKMGDKIQKPSKQGGPPPSHPESQRNDMESKKEIPREEKQKWQCVGHTGVFTQPGVVPSTPHTHHQPPGKGEGGDVPTWI